ncbi:MAG: class I adenylate-forming enzyme family protein, partial [Flavobacteriaceae bacterium]
MLETYLHPDSRLADLKAGRELSAADIARAARDQAGRLAAAGVAPRDRVAIAHDDPGALVADLLAVWSLGAAALVFSHAVAPAERDNLLARSRAVALIARGALAADAVAVAVLAPASPDADPPIPPPATAEPDPDDVALVMMTSGTVAEPKGVMLSHRALAARIDLNRRHIGDGDMARSLNVLPMHFGHGLIGNMLTPLAAGARLAAWPDPGPAGLPALGETLDREAITFMSSVPSLWRAAMKLSRPPAGGTLRRVHIGSAPLTRVLWEDIARWCGTRRVFNMFGMTEAANWIAGIGLDDAPGGDQWVGLPWGGALAVTGPAGERLSTGRGEVCVASPSLMSGYLDREEATREVLSDGWLMTGDNGEIDRAGRLR